MYMYAVLCTLYSHMTCRKKYYWNPWSEWVPHVCQSENFLALPCQTISDDCAPGIDRERITTEHEVLVQSHWFCWSNGVGFVTWQY